MSTPSQAVMTTAPETAPGQPVRYDVGLLTDHDVYLFNEGTHHRLYDNLVANELTGGGEGGMGNGGRRNSLRSPISIYEVHLGSWMRVPEEGNRPLTYREIALKLAGHVKKLGFTHVELMPVMEHPFYGSWGYQITGYYAATSRYGSPQDLMYLIDCLHQYGIGVILDWVPAPFPTANHGPAYSDATPPYEHDDA